MGEQGAGWAGARAWQHQREPAARRAPGSAEPPPAHSPAETGPGPGLPALPCPQEPSGSALGHQRARPWTGPSPRCLPGKRVVLPAHSLGQAAAPWAARRPGVHIPTQEALRGLCPPGCRDVRPRTHPWAAPRVQGGPAPPPPESRPPPAPEEPWAQLGVLTGRPAGTDLACAASPPSRGPRRSCCCGSRGPTRPRPHSRASQRGPPHARRAADSLWKEQREA